MLIFLFGTSSDIDRFDKLRKSLKENKKIGLYSGELLLNELKTIAAILEVKVKLLEETLYQKLRNIHIEKVMTVAQAMKIHLYIRELKYANQLKKDLSSSSAV